MNRRELLALGLASLSASSLAPLTAVAQGRYPERPIKLLVAFSAGGVNDVVARQWADRVKTRLGTVYVENQGGASGTIATAEVALEVSPAQADRLRRAEAQFDFELANHDSTHSSEKSRKNVENAKPERPGRP